MNVLDRVRQMFGQAKEKVTGDAAEAGAAAGPAEATSATEPAGPTSAAGPVEAEAAAEPTEVAEPESADSDSTDSKN